MASARILPTFFVLFIITNASVIPTVKVLQGPGSRTSLYGPDGSALESSAPGGTLVTDGNQPGLVAAGPAHFPSSADIVVGGGPAGKIVTSYTLAGPAVVPAVAPSAAIVAAPTAISRPAAALIRLSLGHFGSEYY